MAFSLKCIFRTFESDLEKICILVSRSLQTENKTLRKLFLKKPTLNYVRVVSFHSGFLLFIKQYTLHIFLFTKFPQKSQNSV